MLELILLVVIIVLVAYYQFKLRSIHEKIYFLAVEEAKKLFNEWKKYELEVVKRSIEESLKKDFESQLEKWKLIEEKKIREDAVKRSLATILGKVGEELAPLVLFLSLNIEPKDLRHLGSPVDYVAFKGFSRGIIEEILFIEVKTSESSRLSDIEREVKRAVEEKRIRYVVMNIREEFEKLLREQL